MTAVDKAQAAYDRAEARMNAALERDPLSPAYTRRAELAHRAFLALLNAQRKAKEAAQ